ncbi:DUF4429 domain-containing protein [Streptomyces sp. 3MP-14]|uniref:DUF4429 domain-containing protein n=1 Tax=Streptomyces mimosae TaxID=2586635 RepID=A0A5N6AT25_9ACTN|nr:MULTISPECIES: DUF4429 domain-containing protein [Streptomyces]KAB8171252.1 DUF4429 domain-containing protein [Streptomyces mimosae]KAB8179863.1 DUF4429 domain-containing protein [Streptomyces sp. 3MP-14]
MAEISQPSGAWYFEGDVLRIVPGHGKGVHLLRSSLGELVVPLTAVASVSHESGRKSGRLRLRLRHGADPLVQATGGRLPDAADPYQLEVARDRSGVAEYLVESVRNALLIEQVPGEPCDRYLLPGPSVPLTLHASDGEVTFDGEQLRITWGWGAEESKKSAGPRTLGLDDLAEVQWTPPVGWENGFVRFLPKGVAPAAVKPAHDPNTVVLWGLRMAKDIAESALLTAAVLARLPHPSAHSSAGGPGRGAGGRLAKAPEAPALPAGEGAAPDHDTILRRLRELGELHRSGVLTDEEFTAAKKAMIDRL